MNDRLVEDRLRNEAVEELELGLGGAMVVGTSVGKILEKQKTKIEWMSISVVTIRMVSVVIYLKFSALSYNKYRVNFFQTYFRHHIIFVHSVK